MESKLQEHTLIIVNCPGDEACVYLLENDKMTNEIQDELKNPWNGKSYLHGIKIVENDGCEQYMSVNLFNYLQSPNAKEISKHVLPYSLTITSIHKYELGPAINAETIDKKNVDFYSYCQLRNQGSFDLL